MFDITQGEIVVPAAVVDVAEVFVDTSVTLEDRDEFGDIASNVVKLVDFLSVDIIAGDNSVVFNVVESIVDDITVGWVEVLVGIPLELVVCSVEPDNTVIFNKSDVVDVEEADFGCKDVVSSEKVVEGVDEDLVVVDGMGVGVVVVDFAVVDFVVVDAVDVVIILSQYLPVNIQTTNSTVPSCLFKNNDVVS